MDGKEAISGALSDGGFGEKPEPGPLGPALKTFVTWLRPASRSPPTALPTRAVFLHHLWDTPALCTCSSFCLAAPPPPFPSFFWASDRCAHSFMPHVPVCSSVPRSRLAHRACYVFRPPTVPWDMCSKTGLQWPRAGPGPQTFSFTSLSSTHELITDGADQPHSSPNLVNLGTVGFPRDIRIVEQGFEASLHRRNGSGCSKAPRPMTWKGRCGRSRCASVLLLGIARPYGRDAWSWPTYSSSFSHCMLSFVCLSISSLQEARIIDISGLPYM